MLFIDYMDVDTHYDKLKLRGHERQAQYDKVFIVMGSAEGFDGNNDSNTWFRNEPGAPPSPLSRPAPDRRPALRHPSGGRSAPPCGGLAAASQWSPALRPTGRSGRPPGEKF